MDINLIETFAEFKEFKNINRETLMHILEKVFREMIIKKYGSDDNFDIIVNIDRGDLEIWRNREIVENLKDENLEIELSQAIEIEPDFEVGEEFSEELKFSDFGRRDILTIRQNLISKINEYENDSIYSRYKDKIGEIITGEIYQIWKKEILVLDDEDIELILPKSEQIPSEFYRKGETIKAVVSKVEIRNNNPIIIISRTSPVFLEKLFEAEVPEVYDGLITIKKIVRAPGERAKIAVETYDDRIDPVGACVGMKGSRIRGIVRELKNENIDVINYSTNTNLYISRSLSPAKTSSIEIDEENKKVNVYLKPDQVSLAIGKGGFNIRLAGKLVGYEINVYREDEIEIEDVDIREFSDEIDQWIIDELIAIGCDTAKSVLELNIEELAQRTELEKATVKEIIRILSDEFK